MPQALYDLRQVGGVGHAPQSLPSLTHLSQELLALLLLGLDLLQTLAAPAGGAAQTGGPEGIGPVLESGPQIGPAGPVDFVLGGGAAQSPGPFPQQLQQLLVGTALVELPPLRTVQPVPNTLFALGLDLRFARQGVELPPAAAQLPLCQHVIHAFRLLSPWGDRAGPLSAGPSRMDGRQYAHGWLGFWPIQRPAPDSHRLLVKRAAPCASAPQLSRLQ